MVDQITDDPIETAAAKTETVTAEAAPATEAEPAAETIEDVRAKHAASVIRNNIYLSAASGLIPVPYVDTATLAAVNLKLLKELADVYNVPFRADIGKEAIAVLLASVTPPLVAGGILGGSLVKSALRAIPVVGAAVGLVTLPVFHAAFTYALGAAFRKHFATGGTFLTFDVEATKTYFRKKYDTYRNRKAHDATAEAPAAA